MNLKMVWLNISSISWDIGRVPKDRSWRAAKIMMGRVDQFLDSLINYDKENIHPDVIKAIQAYLDDPEFDPEFVRSKSTAAAGLCWRGTKPQAKTWRGRRRQGVSAAGR